MNSNLKESKLLAALQAIRQDFEALAIREINAHPEWPYWMVAEHVGLSEATVQRISKSHNMSRPTGPRPKSKTRKEGGV
jgi:hypothetical protein